MKKKYITPICEVYSLMNPPKLMAGSDTLIYDPTSDPITDPEYIH